MILFFASGTICYALLYNLTVESVQFFTNIVIPVFCIFIGFSLVIALVLKQRYLAFIVFALLLISISFNKAGIYWVHRLKRTDLALTKKILDKNGPGNFVTLKSKKELSGFIGINTEYDLPLLYIDYLQKPYLNITLNTPELVLDSSNPYQQEQQTILNRSSYSEYVFRNANKIPGKEMMFSFLRQYSMRYFCVSPDTILPAGIRPLVTDSVRLENKWTIYRITP